MFRKKKDIAPATMPPVPKKSGLGKRLERRFFNIFNDKTNRRRSIGTAVLLTPLAFVYAQGSQPDPSTKRGINGSAHVEQYQSEISRLGRDSHNILFDANRQVAKGQNFAALQMEARATDLATRLSLDTQISEDDAMRLARMFLRDMQDPVFSDYIKDTMRAITADSEYLADARTRLANDPQYQALRSPDKKSTAVLSEMQEGQSKLEILYDFFFGYIFMFLFFETTAGRILRRGSQRDDKLKQDERTETLKVRADEIRDLLTPKKTAHTQPKIKSVYQSKQSK